MEIIAYVIERTGAKRSQIMRTVQSSQKRAKSLSKTALTNGGRAHYVMVSKIQWTPYWLATQLYPPNDWTGWQNGVNDDVCAQAPLCTSRRQHYCCGVTFEWARTTTSQFTQESRPVQSIQLGGKPKWLPLNFGYHDLNAYRSNFWHWDYLSLLLFLSPSARPMHHWLPTLVGEKTFFDVRGVRRDFSQEQPIVITKNLYTS